MRRLAKLISGTMFLATALSCASQGLYAPGADTNILLWLKADALNVTNGGRISSWVPSAGRMSQPIRQTASGSQPIFVTAAQNGLPAILFDGASTFLTNGTISPAAAQPLTIGIVYKYMGPGGSQQKTFIGNIANTSPWAVGYHQDNISVYAGGNFGNALPYDSNWHVIMFLLNGTNSTYRIDGGTDTPITGGTGTNAITSLEIGGQANATWSFANVYLGEILIYNGDQSTNQAAIFEYLESRWAIIAERQNPPFTLSWTDRRPIGMDFLGASTAATTNNPRGWFNSSSKDYVSTNGILQFRKELLTRATNEVQILSNIHAQGLICWDIEGDEIRSMLYWGDPRQLSLLAPEMDAVADEFFSLFRAAGFRVGVCVRPNFFAAGNSLPTFPTNGQSFVLTSAPFQRKLYQCIAGTWVQTNAVSQQTINEGYYSNLLGKIEYAKVRWGATLFYVDSMGVYTDYGKHALSNIMQLHPEILLIPEVSYLANSNRTTSMPYFAVAAPFLMPNWSGYQVPTEVTSNYPGAFAAIDIYSSYTNAIEISRSIRAGNIMMVNSWYTNVGNSVVKDAYEVYKYLQPPQGFRVQH